MKKIVVFTALVLLSASSCKKEAVSVNTLTEAEQSDLVFLREEEKLARDVYRYAYKKYNQSIFSNISESEQTHTSTVLELLTKYNIDDPAAGAAEGVFKNRVLQNLYVDLTAKCDSSLQNALVVGATIEDLDIHDIDGFYANTVKSDLTTVYDRLTCGSRNHIRSFNDQLKNLQITYQAQFLSANELATILAGTNEQCGGK